MNTTDEIERDVHSFQQEVKRIEGIINQLSDAQWRDVEEAAFSLHIALSRRCAA